MSHDLPRRVHRGGGQPYAGSDSQVLDAELLAKRSQALYIEDESMSLRRSYENPEIHQIYREFLGHPLSEVSHELLHTFYFQRIPPAMSYRGKIDLMEMEPAAK